MNAKRGSSVASSLDHLFATKVIKITDISFPTRHSFMQMLPTSAFRRHWSGALIRGPSPQIYITSKAQRRGLQPIDTKCIEWPYHTVEGVLS